MSVAVECDDQDVEVGRCLPRRYGVRSGENRSAMAVRVPVLKRAYLRLGSKQRRRARKTAVPSLTLLGSLRDARDDLFLDLPLPEGSLVQVEELPAASQ